VHPLNNRVIGNSISRPMCQYQTHQVRIIAIKTYSLFDRTKHCLFYCGPAIVVIYR